MVQAVETAIDPTGDRLEVVRIGRIIEVAGDPVPARHVHCKSVFFRYPFRANVGEEILANVVPDYSV